MDLLGLIKKIRKPKIYFEFHEDEDGEGEKER
jgi:hypothetical protein